MNKTLFGLHNFTTLDMLTLLINEPANFNCLNEPNYILYRRLQLNILVDKLISTKINY